jgi:hypothetical protein
VQGQQQEEEVLEQQEEEEVRWPGALFDGPPGVRPVPRTLGLLGVLYYIATSPARGRETERRGESSEMISHGNLLHLQDQLSGRHFLVDMGATYSVFPHRFLAPASGPALTSPGSWPIVTWREKEVQLSFDGQHFTWSFLLAAVQFPILSMDFLQQQELLVDAGKHQFIMTASMKVIRVVSPSGGLSGLYTAVASSSPEYRCLFAEFQDVAQHKREFPLPKHDVEHHLQNSGPPLTAKACHLEPTKQQDAKREFKEMDFTARLHSCTVISKLDLRKGTIRCQ